MFLKIFILVCLIPNIFGESFLTCENSTLKEETLRNFTIFDRLVTAWNACGKKLPPLLVYDHYLANNIRDTYLAFVDKTGMEELNTLKTIDELIYKLGNTKKIPKEIFKKMKKIQTHIQEAWDVSDGIMKNLEELQKKYLKIYNDNVFNYYELEQLLLKKKDQYKEALNAFP